MLTNLQQLFNEIQNLKAEIRRLRGKIDRVVSGGTVILDTNANQVPPASQGAMIVGNSTPAWERIAAPSPSANQKYELRFDYGDTQPSWKQAVDDVFVINMAANL